MFRTGLFNLQNLVKNIELKRCFFDSRYPLNAGHSKWANIRHIKAEKDGQKAALFTRLSRQLRLAIQEGGSADPSLNSHLRTAVEEALRKNMPMTTIQNNIKKFCASKDDVKKYLLELRYQQKVFAVCVAYTDKFPGLKMEMAPIMRKAGAVFADSSHMFNDFGLIETILQKHTLCGSMTPDEKSTMDAIDCDAEDVYVVDPDEGTVNFICNPMRLTTVKKSLAERGYFIENAEHVFAARNLVELTSDELTAYSNFVRKIKELPGLEDVYDNVASPNS